jgi:hypothetical protein
MPFPYVYKISHKTTNQFYIGFRSANKAPAHLDLGIKYFTSSKHVSMLGFENFNIDWIEVFNEADIAYKFEQLMIHESFKDLLCLNKSCYFGKPHFNSVGLRWNNSKETKEKNSAIAKARFKDPKNHPMYNKRGTSNPKYGKSCVRQSIAMKGRGLGDKNNFYGKGLTTWINNGVINIRLNKNDCMPDGFNVGRLITWNNKQTGDKTSGFGSKWVTNGVNNIKIYPINNKLDIPEGYHLGRTNKRRTKT